ncbi:hypothetical protein A2Y99_05305 [Candidatus Gottesmanbacteria bacterium RBG_13_37_7]|uniref:Condensin complex subunit 1 C-terminal domain-containing protein n=1 Tax=Candidatus Gottesmanbacteria bacterium RBG_13_37_7 TaxID=1798369 RepID=A0A1F5YKG3_9BACT|nr:MAG: hypothetical protein A2Y99_05305 [Candidatus Gottesmanbacteria bacterium RBG_13_37_7]HJX50762.1 hypothetical protein [Candidatus Nanoarchaeia archaeon]
MTKLLEEIRKSDRKPKDLLNYLTELIRKDKKLLQDLEVSIQSTKDAERGICMEALEYITHENPEYAAPHLKTIITSLSDKAPRVKWEAARIMGNIAKKYSEEALGAIPNLMKNTNDKGTVVRWSAAFGLTEIAIYNSKAANKLIPEFEKIIKKEKNNGVKNVYLKALKKLKIISASLK